MTFYHADKSLWQRVTVHAEPTFDFNDLYFEHLLPDVPEEDVEALDLNWPAWECIDRTVIYEPGNLISEITGDLAFVPHEYA